MSDNLQASAKGARKKALFLLAAVAVLSLGLLGAGTARMLYFWGGTAGDPGMQRIGDQHLYTAIGQKRQSGQVTITVTAAYADKGRTLIAYTLQPSLEMAKAYQNISVGAYSLTDQDGREGQSSNTTCAAFMHDGSPIHCLITLAPFSLKTGVSNVTMTWDVTKLISVRGNASGFQYLAGDWRFQFTLPVHSLDNGSSGPMAQPTSLP